MTTLLHKTNAHEKARALSSGFLELIKALTPTPRQGLASECISLVIDHENNNSISIIDIASIRARKVWYRRSEGLQIERSARKSLWPANIWRAE